MATHQEGLLSPPLSAGPSGARAMVASPGGSHFSSFSIDDILGQEGRLAKRPATTTWRPSTSRSFSSYQPVTPLTPSPPSSPVDASGWPAACHPSAVSPDALALDGGGVLGDFRLLPPPFTLFHQNVMVPGPTYPNRECRRSIHHRLQRFRDLGSGAFMPVLTQGSARSYLTDTSLRGNLERWTPLPCHILALRQSRVASCNPGGAAALGLCSNKRKGGQVRFSPDQTTALERRFGGHKYLSPEERRILADDLKLTDRQVKTWFQNRRAKWRRASQPTTSVASGTNIDNGANRNLGQSDDVGSSRHSTASSGAGVDTKGCDSDMEDEVFQEENLGVVR